MYLQPSRESEMCINDSEIVAVWCQRPSKSLTVSQWPLIHGGRLKGSLALTAVPDRRYWYMSSDVLRMVHLQWLCTAPQGVVRPGTAPVEGRGSVPTPGISTLITLWLSKDAVSYISWAYVQSDCECIEGTALAF